jgi:hypothetical protein
MNQWFGSSSRFAIRKVLNCPLEKVDSLRDEGSTISHVQYCCSPCSPRVRRIFRTLLACNVCPQSPLATYLESSTVAFAWLLDTCARSHGVWGGSLNRGDGGTSTNINPHKLRGDKHKSAV